MKVISSKHLREAISNIAQAIYHLLEHMDKTYKHKDIYSYSVIKSIALPFIMYKYIEYIKLLALKYII
jgi:hypothetical protein